MQGTVVRLAHGAHHPLIEFVTKSGERVSFPGSFVTMAFGGTVPVRYDPGQAASQRNSRHVHEHVARVDHLDRVHDGVSLRRLEEKVASAEAGGRALGSAAGIAEMPAIDTDATDAKKPPLGRLYLHYQR